VGRLLRLTFAGFVVGQPTDHIYFSPARPFVQALGLLPMISIFSGTPIRSGARSTYPWAGIYCVLGSDHPEESLVYEGSFSLA